MRRITAPLRSLDAETQGYIRLVYASSGRGCPGVFVDGNPVPPLGKAALGFGVAILLVGGFVAFHTNKDAYAAALLLAAAVLLGGWLTWFGVRELFGSGFSARFSYFDPTHAYQVAGREVTITRVADAGRVAARGAGVRFVGDDGQRFVPLPRRAAAFVERFYDAVRSLEADPGWGRLDPAGIGGVARFVAVERRHPESAGEIDVRVRELPADPLQAGSPLDGGLIGAFAAAAMAFLLGVAIFQPMRDHGGFAAAQVAGAPGLRGYLTDERNTAHRDEAKRLLAALYDGPIAKVKSAGPIGQQAARDGFAAILETLRDAPQPVVSISVTEAGNADGAILRQMRVRTDLADSLGLFVGQELIAFAKNPDDKNAHVAVAYTPRPDGVEWTIAFRTTPDAAPVELPPQTVTGTVTAPNFPTALRNAVFLTLFGQPAPLVPPPVVEDDGGGDW